MNHAVHFRHLHDPHSLIKQQIVMKKFSLVALSLIMSMTAFAQREIRVGVKIAPEISFRIAGWDPGPGYTYSFGQVGYVVGAQLLISHIETGLYYYQQHAVQHVSLGYDIYYTPRFLHIPILWRQEINNFYFTAGPSVNANLGIGRKIENQTVQGTVTFKDANDGASIAVGFHVSAGYTFKINETLNAFSEFRFGGIIQDFTPGTVGIGIGVNKRL